MIADTTLAEMHRCRTVRGNCQRLSHPGAIVRFGLESSVCSVSGKVSETGSVAVAGAVTDNTHD